MATTLYLDVINDEVRTLTTYEGRAQRIDTYNTDFPANEYYRRVWQDEDGNLYAFILREVWAVEPIEWTFGYTAMRPVGFKI